MGDQTQKNVDTSGAKTKHKASIPLIKQYGYGLGEFGLNFLITFVTFYLTFFLTNIALIPTAIAATIVTITTAIKCVTMPIAGVVVDKVRFKKSRFRMWAFVGAVIFFIGGSLMFTDFHLSVEIYSVVFVIFFFVYWLGYSIAWVAHRALMDPMSQSPADKLALTSSSAQMGAIARIVYIFGAAGIIGAFPADQVAFGYNMVAIVFGIIAVLGFVAVYFITKPYDNNKEAGEETAGANQAGAAPKMTAKDFLLIIKTRPMLIFIVAMILRCAVLTVLGTLLLYYLTYVLEQPGLVATYMVITYFIAFFGALIVKPVANKIGKRSTFIWTSFLSAICVFALLVTGANGTAFIVLMALFQFFGIFSSTLIPTFMADIGEYTAITQGSKARAFVFSIGGMSIQLSSVVGAAIAAFGLVVIGFDAAAVTPEAIAGLSNLFIFGIGGLTVLAAVLFFAYPLTENYMEELRTGQQAQNNAPEA